MSAVPPADDGERATELREPGGPGEPDAFPVRRVAPWMERHDGLVAGLTVRGEGVAGEPADFGFTTAPSASVFHRRFESLASQLGFPAVAVPRQVHGDAVVCLEATPEGGVRVPGEADALVTGDAGLLLAVTAADCVPVYLHDPTSGGLGLAHAGWRGLAAGVLRAAVRAMGGRFGVDPGSLRVHLGPGICGECYRVGPEVLRALGRPAPEGGGRVDLRDELERRARSLGVRARHTSRSAWCTRCRADQFHSHRGRGERAGRMAAYLGWRHRPEVVAGG